MDLASHLGISLARCKLETTSREFVQWKIYLEKKENEVTRDQHYLAQIALEVRRTLVKKPSSLRLKNFLLKFTRGKGKQKMTKKQAAMIAKSKWFGILGFDKKLYKDADKEKEASDASSSGT